MPKKPRQEPQPTTALGSGFFISDDGYLVTNNHVVDNADNFTVTAEDGTEYHAKLIGKDDRTDLALLKVSSGKPFPYVEDTAVDPQRLGEYVRRFDQIVRDHGTTAGYYGHASVGCLHIRPLVSLKSKEGLDRMFSIAEAVSDTMLVY